MRYLHKSEHNRVFDGVCGGIGEYLGIDPVIIRLLWVVLIIFGGTGILAYLIAMLIMPGQTTISSDEVENTAMSDPIVFSDRFWGMLLLIIGSLLILRFLGPFQGMFSGLTVLMGSKLWPVLLIAAGLYLVFSREQTSDADSTWSDVISGKRRIYKDEVNKKLFGVCSGIGNYFDVDANLVRIFWVIVTLAFFGIGILTYILLAIFLPSEPAKS